MNRSEKLQFTFIQPLVDQILIFGDKINELIICCRDFYQLEKEVQRQSLEMTLGIFAWVLQEIDTHLMNAREGAGASPSPSRRRGSSW
ncbi:hypothetical protein C7438_1261 [Brockia lithotrophica]|uniref:Uncharacterized protein n=2 Tax=Brockia lithotrophica TaxID=933949 RepID=A0A660L1N2_9BACL|nr:hypothetical protein C7438_1261 [Brockia lithotrophica]